MRSCRFAPLLFAALLATFSCSKSNSDNQASATAQVSGEEIDPNQNLVFQFDEPVVPASQATRWDTTRYVSFEPSIRGKFKWSDDGRELVFSPLEPFRPSTVFQAALRPSTLPSGKQKVALSKPKFHTPFLQLGGAQVFYGRSSRAANTAELRANVQFNYPVRPSDLRTRLHVSQNGHPVAFTLTAAEPDKTLGLTLNQEAKPGAPLHFEVDAGLNAVAGRQPTATALQADAEVPDQQTLQVRELSGHLLGGQPVVTLLTNQPVSVADIQPLLKVEPAVPYAVETLESGLALRGGFEVGKTYTITIDPGMRGALGGQLTEKFSQVVSFGNEPPSISFASAEKAMYLGASGNRNLGLRLNGVENVKVTVAKIYASNVQDVLRTGTQYGYDSGSDDDSEDEGMGGSESEDGEYVDRSYQYYELENRGDVLFTRTYATNGLSKENGLRLLNLSLQDLEFAGPLKGLYVVRVQDAERQWMRQEKLVALTDLGLIARQNGGGGAVVFVNSLRGAQPVSGATVRFISTSNQVMGTAVSNGQGVARFDSVAGSPLRLGMVTATRDADFSFLSLTKSQVETSRFNVGGLSSNAAHYQAFLYGDRDLYRPGDTLHTNVVVRTDDWRTPPAGLPLKVRLLLPTGKEYASLGEKTTATGAVESRFILPPTAMTGTYSLEVLTGNDVLLTSQAISVEEFIPDRLKVTVTAAPAVVRAGGQVTATVAAQNLFGPPAAGRKFEVEFSLKEKVFSAPKYPTYDFTINTGERVQRSEYGEDVAPTGIAAHFQKEVRQGETAAAGRGTAAYQLPDVRDLGTLEGVAFATIFDETGRPVNRLASFEVQTQATMFGIERLPDLVGTHQALPIRLLALTPAGKPTVAPAQVRVTRLLWETVLERQGGRYVYNSQKREQTLSAQTLQVGAGTSFSFTPTYSGEYEVRVSRPGASSYVASHFYAYGSGDTASNSFEVNTEGEVTIEADKPKYEPGETAQLLLKTPFPGRVLVTVERNRVLDHFYVDTDQKSARVRVPIRTGHVPNVYVTATAIRPIGADNTLPLTVARGFVPLTVEKPGTHLPLTLKAPTQSRSQTFQTIEVQTAPRAQVTLAVVDEGILQRKNYQTPDPYHYFYQKRALEVSAYDIYPFLLPELGSSSSGGDAADLARRTSPVPSRRVKLVAKWSGLLTADAAGIVRYRVRVPQFSGALRVMAVAYKDDAFASAEHTMKVADPVVISTALPRFASPGDTVEVAVTYTNTTGTPIEGEARFGINIEPKKTGQKLTASEQQNRHLVQILSTNIHIERTANMTFDADLSQTLAPNTEKRCVFKFIAREVGVVELFSAFQSFDKRFTQSFREVIELPIRPAAPLATRTGSGELTAGKPAALDLRTDFLPSTLRSQLLLSRSPLTQFSKNLNYLLKYPYGCLEQTVSAAFPQLYFGDLAATLAQQAGTGPRPQRYNPNYHVQEAIRKIESMQLYNDSLSYWPGGDYDNWWATAYAAHFLLEAKQAGFTVNQSLLDKVLRYLQLRLRKRETEKYQYFDVNSIARERVIAPREVAYSLYVLALAGRPDAVALNYYKANRQLLTADARYLLACTFALGGQQLAFRNTLPTTFTPDSRQRELDGAFASPIRDEALVLNALLETDPTNPQVAALARQLSRQVHDAGYLNTQESAFSLLALGKIARRARGSTATATIAAGGKELGKFDGKDLTVKNVANYQLLLKAMGSGPLYYFWQEEGVSASGRVQEQDHYLKVRRYFADRNGRPLAAPNFKQNDLVLVVIALQSADAAGEVKNVAITDLLPAGLEIENPRLGVQRDVALPGLATPDYLDVRDDRLNIFTTATPQLKVFAYLARAVSKGTFKLGPVSADAMYNAEYRSYHGAGVVRVR